MCNNCFPAAGLQPAERYHAACKLFAAARKQFRQVQVSARNPISRLLETRISPLNPSTGKLFSMGFSTHCFHDWQMRCLMVINCGSCLDIRFLPQPAWPYFFWIRFNRYSQAKKAGTQISNGCKCACQNVQQNKQNKCGNDSIQGRKNQRPGKPFDVKVGVNFLDGVSFHLRQKMI